MNFAQQDTTGFDMNNYTISIEEALVRFFSKCNGIVGHEANLRILVIPITGSGFIRSPNLPNAMDPIVSL